MSAVLRPEPQSGAYRIQRAGPAAAPDRGGIEQVMAGMERGLAESNDGVALAGSLDAALRNLKQTSAAGIADVRAVARLSSRIAAETSRILDESSDGAASRTLRTLAEVSRANARAAAEAGHAAAEIERAMMDIATSADDLERISGGLREAAGPFQV
jgi:methyl-accepting chemotaxis protein